MNEVCCLYLFICSIIPSLRLVVCLLDCFHFFVAALFHLSLFTPLPSLFSPRPFGSALLMHVVAALDQMETGQNLDAVAHSPDVSHGSGVPVVSRNQRLSPPAI